MNNKSRLLLLACASLSYSPLAAQTVRADTSKIDQIVVTAARTPLKTSQVGAPLTIITREDIERREARQVTDLLRSVPGFSVSQSGVAGSQAQVRVRGAEANHILVLVDGVRANDPATGDEFRWEYLSTGNVERIEIVRGPQSSLWGSDAVSAVVHIITRTGQTGFRADGYFEGGSFDSTNAGLNGSIGRDGWSLSGGIEHHATDGSNISRAGNEDDDSELTTASITAKYSATEALSFDFGVRAVDAYSQFDPVDFFVTGLPTDADVATDARNAYARIGATLKSKNRQLTHGVNARFFDSANRNLVDGIEDSSTASNRLSITYQADISIGENLLSLALEHESTEFEQRGANIFSDPNQDQEIDVNSFVAEYQGMSFERISWILSARYDDNSDFDSSVNGRLSAAFKLSGATTLRGSIGTGQKNPTFTERFGFFPGQFVGNSSLNPERSTSYDIGIDQRLADDALSVQISLFRQDLRDEINGFVFDPVTFLSTAENMPGKSERSGVELAARWTLNNTFGFGAHYTYTDSTEQNLLGDDVRELRRPRHSGGLSVDFRSANERFNATLNADFGGERTDIFFPPFPDPSRIVTLSDYWLLDLAVRYQVTAAITLFAKGNNLLDEEYEQVYGYRTSGRAGYLGARLTFGQQ